MKIVPLGLVDKSNRVFLMHIWTFGEPNDSGHIFSFGPHESSKLILRLDSGIDPEVMLVWGSWDNDPTVRRA